MVDRGGSVAAEVSGRRAPAPGRRRLAARVDVAAVRARPTLFAYQLLYQLVPATSGRLATPRPGTVTVR